MIPYPRKFYAVANGRKPGIYTTWNECRDQVQGFKKARFKSFMDMESAREFVEKYQDDLKKDGYSTSVMRETYPLLPKFESKIQPINIKALQKKDALKSATQLTLRQPKLKSRNHNAKKIRGGRHETALLIESFGQNAIQCWTDGSCLSNPGGAGGAAAIVVFPFLTKLPRGFKSLEKKVGNIHNEMETKVLNCNEIARTKAFQTCTNNITELSAIHLALTLLDDLRLHSHNDDGLTQFPVHIMTDSQYSEKVLTGKWRSHCNFEYINPIKDLLAKMQKRGQNVSFHWVRGHCDITYNQKVDELARGVALQCFTSASAAGLAEE